MGAAPIATYPSGGDDQPKVKAPVRPPPVHQGDAVENISGKGWLVGRRRGRRIPGCEESEV